MPHATPTRPAHRAPGGPALLTGRRPHRTVPPRTMHLMLSGLGALILLGIAGLTTFFVVAENRRGAPVESTAAVSPAAIASRLADPEPLRLTEIYPRNRITLTAGAEPYRISMTHIDTDCDTATTGELGQILADQGCTQVVRASMTAPYGGYEVTAGIFNLADESGTAQVAAQLTTLVQSGRGTFGSMAAGAAPGSDPQAEPRSRVSWQDRGHYLVFCVITRPNGNPVAPHDPYAQRITTDLLSTYLSEERLGVRALNL